MREQRHQLTKGSQINLKQQLNVKVTMSTKRQRQNHPRNKSIIKNCYEILNSLKLIT